MGGPELLQETELVDALHHHAPTGVLRQRRAVGEQRLLRVVAGGGHEAGGVRRLREDALPVALLVVVFVRCLLEAHLEVRLRLVELLRHRAGEVEQAVDARGRGGGEDRVRVRVLVLAAPLRAAAHRALLPEVVPDHVAQAVLAAAAAQLEEVVDGGRAQVRPPLAGPVVRQPQHGQRRPEAAGHRRDRVHDRVQPQLPRRDDLLVQQAILTLFAQAAGLELHKLLHHDDERLKLRLALAGAQVERRRVVVQVRQDVLADGPQAHQRVDLRVEAAGAQAGAAPRHHFAHPHLLMRAQVAAQHVLPVLRARREPARRLLLLVESRVVACELHLVEHVAHEGGDPLVRVVVTDGRHLLRQLEGRQGVGQRQHHQRQRHLPRRPAAEGQDDLAAQKHVQVVRDGYTAALHRANVHALGGERRTLVGEGRTLDRDRVVSSRHQHHTKHTLVSAHDEVAAGLAPFLVEDVGKLTRRAVVEHARVAAHHHRHVSREHPVRRREQRRDAGAAARGEAVRHAHQKRRRVVRLVHPASLRVQRRAGRLREDGVHLLKRRHAALRQARVPDLLPPSEPAVVLVGRARRAGSGCLLCALRPLQRRAHECHHAVEVADPLRLALGGRAAAPRRRARLRAERRVAGCRAGPALGGHRRRDGVGRRRSVVVAAVQAGLPRDAADTLRRRRRGGVRVLLALPLAARLGGRRGGRGGGGGGGHVVVLVRGAPLLQPLAVGLQHRAAHVAVGGVRERDEVVRPRLEDAVQRRAADGRPVDGVAALDVLRLPRPAAHDLRHLRPHVHLAKVHLDAAVLGAQRVGDRPQVPQQPPCTAGLPLVHRLLRQQLRHPLLAVHPHDALLLLLILVLAAAAAGAGGRTLALE
eukprot:Rhum_TRINITY_DN15245_c1_g1::Rhum_TRINITY_DN15245_c1_g1_i1::g.146809::m.146809